MPKFIIEAKSTKFYKVPVEAEDEMDAIAKLDDWISDDFEGFEVGAQWDFEAEEDDEGKIYGVFGILKHETKPELVFDSEQRFDDLVKALEWVNGEEGDLYEQGFHDEFDKEEYEGYWLDDIDIRVV